MLDLHLSSGGKHTVVNVDMRCVCVWRLQPKTPIGSLHPGAPWAVSLPLWLWARRPHQTLPFPPGSSCSSAPPPPHFVRSSCFSPSSPPSADFISFPTEVWSQEGNGLAGNQQAMGGRQQSGESRRLTERLGRGGLSRQTEWGSEDPRKSLQVPGVWVGWWPLWTLLALLWVALSNFSWGGFQKVLFPSSFSLWCHWREVKASCGEEGDHGSPGLAGDVWTCVLHVDSARGGDLGGDERYWRTKG